MSLDGYKIPVSEGLSELKNRAGAWKYIEPSCSIEDDSPLKDYDRKTVLEDGKLRTY